MGEGKMSVVFIDKAEGNVCGYDKLTFFFRGVKKLENWLNWENWKKNNWKNQTEKKTD